MPPRIHTEKVIHDIESDGNLYFLLNGLNGALNKFAERIGGGLQVVGTGLQAIALALSTPNDNSAEVKALTDKLKQTTDALDSATKKAL